MDMGGDDEEGDEWTWAVTKMKVMKTWADDDMDLAKMKSMGCSTSKKNDEEFIKN